ncbi:solute carrier family 1 member 8a isoform X2 [Stigmatopora nigra]
MDELLLPGGEEDAASDRSSCADEDGTADGGRRKPSFCRPPRNVRLALRKFAKRNGLLTLSVVAVLTGCTLGFVLRGTQLSTQAKIYFSFPGELLMRMLKMLILPLITSSLMSGLSSMESRACCRMGVLTVTYYLWTTFIAVVVGIALVVIIKPGVGTEMESNRLGGGPVMTSADALLDLIRNMVPSNLIEATFQQYKTDLLPVLKVPSRTAVPNFVYMVPGEGQEGKARTVSLELTPAPEVTYKTSPGSSQQMNVLGIVIFSATMGLLLGRMGERGAPLVNVCQCINECVMKIINAAVWYFPFGIVFLVAGKILDMQDPSTLGRKLGWYGVTVLAGLFVHGLILLPLFYFLLTRKNPFTFIRGLLQALVIALATSSRWVAGARLGHPAHHHEVSPGELPRGPADRPLRAAGGRHHQHGRHGALRGRGGHLHRAGQRLRAGLWAAGHHQHHGHGRQHRRGRHPSGGPGYHGDRADLRGPSPRRHHADRGHRLDPGPISHHDQRAGRRLGGGYHRPLVSQGFPAGRRGKGGAVVRRHQRPAPRPARGVAYDARAHAQRWRGGGVGSARAHRLLQHLPGLRRNLSDLLPGCMRGGVKKGGKERGMACGHAVSASQLASDFPYRPSRTVPPVLPVSSLNLKSSSTDII